VAGMPEVEDLGCGIDVALMMVTELEVGVGFGEIWRSWTIGEVEGWRELTTEIYMLNVRIM
jgi:hypothetical protein